MMSPPRTTTPQHPRPPSHAGSRPSTALSRQSSYSNPQTNWGQFQARPQSASHTPSGIAVDMPVTPIPSAGEPMDRPSSRNSMKLNPLYEGSKLVAPAGFVNQYIGTVLFVMGSARSSKNNLLLIQCYYSRKPKLN